MRRTFVDHDLGLREVLGRDEKNSAHGEDCVACLFEGRVLTGKQDDCRTTSRWSKSLVEPAYKKIIVDVVAFVCPHPALTPSPEQKLSRGS